MVSVDAYVNETTELADVIFPAPSHSGCDSHYDLAFYQLASVRNIANFTPPMVSSEVEPEYVPSSRRDRRRPDADADGFDDLVAFEVARRETATPGSPAEGMDLAAVPPPWRAPRSRARPRPDAALQGRTGAGLGLRRRARREGLLLDLLERSPHGSPTWVAAPRGSRRCCARRAARPKPPPPELLADLPRLERAAARDADGMVLIGRRHLRSNNRGCTTCPISCVASPAARCRSALDAARLGLSDGGEASVSSRAGSIRVPVEVTDSIMDGRLDPPRLGPGHRRAIPPRKCRLERRRQSLERTSTRPVDELSGNAVLNGVPGRGRAGYRLDRPGAATRPASTCRSCCRLCSGDQAVPGGALGPGCRC